MGGDAGCLRRAANVRHATSFPFTCIPTCSRAAHYKFTPIYGRPVAGKPVAAAPRKILLRKRAPTLQPRTPSQSVLQVDARTAICHARPPCDYALHSPWLGDPIGRQDLVLLVARIGDHGRNRRRARSAAADSFGLLRQLVCLPASPASSLACYLVTRSLPCSQRFGHVRLRTSLGRITRLLQLGAGRAICSQQGSTPPVG